MNLPSAATRPTAAELTRQVCRVICRRKQVAPDRLRAGTDLCRELGFDALDIVEVLLAVEGRFGVSIPDEVPLRTPRDFGQYLHQQLFPAG